MENDLIVYERTLGDRIAWYVKLVAFIAVVGNLFVCCTKLMTASEVIDLNIQDSISPYPDFSPSSPYEEDFIVNLKYISK